MQLMAGFICMIYPIKIFSIEFGISVITIIRTFSLVLHVHSFPEVNRLISTEHTVQYQQNAKCLEWFIDTIIRMVVLFSKYLGLLLQLFGKTYP